MLHELSFGRANLVGTSKGALKFSFERLIASENYLSLILLKLLLIS